MKPKMRLIILMFFAVAIIAMAFSESPFKNIAGKNDIYKPPHFSLTDPQDVLVGTRTSDSTGNMTISAAEIQQSIVSTISYLNGMNLNRTNPSLMITPVAAYIILKGADASGKTVTVAIQLICDGSSMVYRARSKTIVHVCTKNSDCSNCQFITLGNLILTCQCESQNPSDSTTQACQDNSYLLR